MSPAIAGLLFFKTMENTVQITISPLDTWEQDILIAQLSEIGFEAFEQLSGKLLAFIPESKLQGIELNKIIPIEKTIEKKVLEPRNWNEEWEQSFTPVIVDQFCGIRASFHEPIVNVEHEIIITPKMSFGTGHHATTFQVIRMMKEMDFRDRSVLDFGTGTGVLAILACRMNAATVVAIDNDEWSIENCKENIEANNCRTIRLMLTDQLPEGRFDIILANINKHVILKNMDMIAQHSNEKAIIVFSGLLHSDKDEIVASALKYGMTLVADTIKDNWIALKFER